MLKSIDYYKEELLKKYQEAGDEKAFKRYLHSLSVGKKAIEIAKTFNFDLDLKKLEIAGILHDYAKYEPLSRYEEIVFKYNLDPDLLNLNYKLLHSVLGDYIVREDLDINDLEILNAIKYHTLGSLEMDKYAEVIYVADLSENLRIKPGFDKIKYYSKTNFKKAIIEKIEYSLKNNDTLLNRNLLKKYTEET